MDLLRNHINSVRVYGPSSRPISADPGQRLLDKLLNFGVYKGLAAVIEHDYVAEPISIQPKREKGSEIVLMRQWLSVSLGGDLHSSYPEVQVLIDEVRWHDDSAFALRASVATRHDISHVGGAVRYLAQHLLLRRIKESSDLRISSLQSLADQLSDPKRHLSLSFG